MSKQEESQCLRALEQWAYGHPYKDRPFLIFMGRSFTPEEYFLEVERNGDFRQALFQFLSEQSERSGEEPVAMISRAIEANWL